MKYDIPITSSEHAEFCRREAERRYEGTIVRDEYCMLLVRDVDGLEHTDAVLRALSNRREQPICMTKAELLRCLAGLPDDCRVYLDPFGVPPVMEPECYPLSDIRRVEIMFCDGDPDDRSALVRFF